MLALSVPIIWGLGFTLAKVGFVHFAFPPILLSALRFGLTSLILVFFVRPPVGYFLPIFWIALVSATIQYSLTFTGLDGLDASTAIIIVQLEFPFMALLAMILLKDRLGLKGTLGVAFAFMGVVLIAGQPYLRENLTSVAMVASGAAVWAFGQIMIKQLNGAVGSFTLIAWVAVFATPQLFALSWYFEDNQIEVIRATGWQGWGVIVYLGVIMTALGYGIWYHLLGKYPVTKVGPVLLLLPVTSIIGSVVLLDEKLTWVEILGAAIVIVGVWFVTSHRQPA
ncbi:MAG: EamA family transporter [Rhodobacterales bacterium]|nr:EamA family transporter [Pseudomonadota bacterium]